MWPQGLLGFFLKIPDFWKTPISGTKNIAQLLDPEDLAQQITNSWLILAFDLCWCIC